MKKAYKQMFISSIVATLLSWIYAILLLNSSKIVRWTSSSGGSHLATYDRDPNKFNIIDYNTLFTWIFLIPFMFWIITYFLKSSGASKNKSDANINSQNSTIKKPKRNIFAIIGFVLSIIAMFSGFGLFAYFGMTTGIIARIKISETEERGKGLANAAIIIGFIYGILMSILHFL